MDQNVQQLLNKADTALQSVPDEYTTDQELEEQLNQHTIEITNIVDTMFASMFTSKTDANGEKYIYTPLPIVTQYGITMYGDPTTLNIPSLYDGLPIDGKTIYWSNGVLKAKGGEGGGGGVADSVAWVDVYGKPAWLTDTKPVYAYSEIVNPPTIPTALSQLVNDMSFVSSSALSNYLPLSGGTIVGTGSYADTALKIRSSNPIYVGVDLQTANGDVVLALTYYNLLGVRLMNGISGKSFVMGDDGSLFLSNHDGSDRKDIIHSGNIASQSVNYATYASGLLDSSSSPFVYETGGLMFFGRRGSASYIDGYNIYLRSNGSTAFMINPSGNVTIGTPDLASTTYKLYVNGTICANGHIVFNATSDAKIGQQYTTGDTALYNYIKFNGGTNGIQYYSGLWTGGNHSAHQFYTNGSDEPRMVVTNDGNVLIGTTADNGSKLQVNGKITSINGDEDGIFLRYENAGSGKALISTYAIGKNAYAFGQDGARFVINHNSYGDVFNILNGNVLIGTTTDSGYKLDVNGSARINGIPIYKSKDDVLYIDGNLVVRGGLTLYGTNESSSPSIFDSLPIASTSSKGIASFSSSYFTVNNGHVSLIADNVGLNEAKLGAYLTNNGYVTNGVLANYLPLSGGVIESSTPIPIVVKTTYSRAIGFNLRVGQEEKVQLGWDDNSGSFIYNYASNCVIGIKDDGTPYYKKDSQYALLHSGNYSNYALPLSGGKLSGSLTLGASNNTSWIEVGFNRNGVKGYVGFASDSSMELGNERGYIRVSQSGFKYKIDAQEYDVLHSGNISSQLANKDIDGYIRAYDYRFKSDNGAYLGMIIPDGNRSDTIYFANRDRVYRTLFHDGNFNTYSPKLDGTGASGTWGINISGKADYANYARLAVTGVDIDANTNTTPIMWCYGQSSSGVKNWPHGGYGGILTLATEASLDGQLAWEIQHNSTTPTSRLWWRARNNLGWGDDWKQIAFTDGNVASATKLTTARTIWGQSFDGSGNVDGRLFVNRYNLEGNTSGLDIVANKSTYFFAFGTSNYSVGNYSLGNSADGKNWYKEIMTFTDGGNVGIDITNPQYKLDVNGTFNASGAATLGSTLNVSGRCVMADALTVGSSSDLAGTYKLYVNGSTRLGGLSVSGDTTLSGALFVSNSTIFNGETTNRSAAYFANGTTYYVDGAANAKFASLTSVGAVSGTNGSFSGTLSVASTSAFTGKTSHNGGIEATSGLFSNDLTTRAALSVRSTSTLTGGVTIGLAEADNEYYKLYVEGSGYMSANLLLGGSLTFYSQRSLKNVIDERGLSLDELLRIKPTRYTWKDGRDSLVHIGGIADDVEQVMPEVVRRTDDGILTMDYACAAFAVATSLIKPVSEHDRKIEDLQNIVRELECEIEQLKNK